MKIRNLELRTSKLEEMKAFYTELLELPLAKETKEQFSVTAGETILTFTGDHHNNSHQYHYAFNIPNNKLEEAAEWLSSKVELITYKGHPIIHFESWNAHSLYFRDPSGNILEFIARHNLVNESQEKFSYKSIINISEIGLPVTDVLDTVDALQSSFGLSAWRPPHESFSTIGDEEGLIIAVSKGRTWFMSDIVADFHPIKIKIETGKNADLIHEGYLFRSF
ncbi:VOC family protein [Pseudobacillus wudalianchiensis]|uniref:VOC domain-containing protein n=1 Tax=Pseudobacillus wudalianchiensis TaxID=1743143 RepID=A0A1B9B6Q2_9BACI|nr:VOC family protein [Bacillus wudalianchiensis]OCA91790.1 hypothetical protein A8F95_19685 [Bacillus wudalianchiensis]